MRFARAEVGGVLAVANSGAAKLFSEPSDASAHDAEDRGHQDILIGQRTAADQQKAEGKAEGRGQ